LLYWVIPTGKVQKLSGNEFYGFMRTAKLCLKTKIDIVNLDDKSNQKVTVTYFQPLDQGIIEKLKVHYMKLLLRKQVEEVHKERDFRPSLLQSLSFLKNAWECVQPRTIRNCFQKAGFEVDEQASFPFSF
jgi:hypothetical protein